MEKTLKVKELKEKINELDRIVQINNFRLQDHNMRLASNYPASIVNDIRRMRSGWREEIKSCRREIEKLKTTWQSQ